MTEALAAVWFDLYGTLVVIEPLAIACEAVAPGRGSALAERWRLRQLEASWLRTLMGAWQPFDVVTRDALRLAAAELGIDGGLDRLDGAFERLPARHGAAAVLDGLGRAGVLVGVLSNGSAGMIQRTLRAAGLEGSIDEIRSVDAVRRYKPDPAVYELAVSRSGVGPDRIGFVTANGWDAAGAATFGLRVVWLRPDATAHLPAVGAPSPIVAAWGEVRNALGT
jgi:2-haloacid dehalogenase